MDVGTHGVNSIDIRGVAHLLVDGGRAHLVAETACAPGRPAVDPEYLEHAGDLASGYDRAALAEARWSERTLCGRRWVRMVAGDGPPLDRFDDPVHAPDCSTCLRSASRQLDNSACDERIPLIAELVAEELDELGSAHVVGVPGDQVDRVRAAIRPAMRRRGRRCGTLVGDDGTTVHVWLAEPVDEDVMSERLRKAMEHVALLGTDEVRPREDRAIYWNRWGS